MKSMKKRIVAVLLLLAVLFSQGFVYAADAVNLETVGAAAAVSANGDVPNGGAVSDTLNDDTTKADEETDSDDAEVINESDTEETVDSMKEADENEQESLNEPAVQNGAELTAQNAAVMLAEYSGGIPEYLDLSLTKTQYLVGDSAEVVICSGTERIAADDEHITYSSSNPEFFTVSDEGNIEAVDIGNSVITVTFTADGGETVINSFTVFCTTKNVTNNLQYVLMLSGTENDPAGIGSSGVFKGSGSGMIYTNPIAKRMMQTWFYDDGKANGNIFGIFIGRSSAGNASMFFKRTGGADGYYYVDVEEATASGEFKAENMKGNGKSKNRKAGWHQLSLLNISGIGSKTLRRILIDGELIAEFESSNIEMQGLGVIGTSTYVKDAYYVANMSTAAAGTIESTSFIYNKPENNLPDSPLEITFSRELDENYIDDSWITLTENGNRDVKIRHDLEIEGNILRVTPHFLLKNNTEYRITIGSGVRFIELANKPGFLGKDSARRFPTSEAELYGKDWKNISDSSSLAAEVTLVNRSADSRTAYMVMNVFDGEKSIETVTKKYVLEPNSGENTGCSIASAVTDISGKSAEVYVWEDIGEGLGKALCDSFTIGSVTRVSESAYAADSSYVDIDMNQDTGRLTVKGYSKTERLGMSVIVCITSPRSENPSETYDYKTADENSFSTVYYRTEQIYTAENGTFGYSMPLTGISGNYGVIVRLPYDDNEYAKTVSFVSEDERNELISLLNTADSTNIAARFAEIATKLGIAETRFDELNNKTYVYNYLLKKNDYSSTTEIKDCYYAAMEKIVQLEASDESTLKYLADNAAMLNIDGHTGYKYMLDAKDNVRSELLAKIRMCASDDKIKSIIEEKAAAVALKHITNYSEVYGIIKSLNEYIGANLTAYGKLSTEKQATVQKEFIDKVTDSTTNANIRATFDDKVKKLASGSTNSSSGGSGGGGGGGGTSSRTNTKVISGELVKSTDGAPQYTLPQWVIDERELQNRVSFSDLAETEWAKESINNLYNKNIINGYEDGRFGVNDNITREQLVKILVLAGGLTMPEGGSETNFADVNKSEWYSEYIDIAVANGIINGMSDGRFGVGQFVTREDASAMIYRLSQSKNAFLDEDITIHPFKDTEEISEYARHAVEVLRESFIINGLEGNYFAPKTNLTRAEAAKIVYGYMNYVG